MLKRLLKITIFLLLVGLFFYKNFLYYDPSNKCFIKIKPSIIEFSAGNIKEAIKVLKLTVPEEYEKLCANVDKINPNYSCGGLGGGCYYTKKVPSREIDISTSHGGFLGWTAAVIAHETCHAIQHNEGRPLVEQECYEVDDWVLRNSVEY